MDNGKFKVLHVEDDSVNRSVIHHLFKKLPGIQLLEAETAELGLSIAEREDPDLIIMDIELPGMNGYEALERLKSNPLTRHITVLAISAYAFESDVARGKKAGFYDYITKPIQVDGFLQLIRRLSVKINT